MELIRIESAGKRQSLAFSLGPLQLSLHDGEVLGIIGAPGAGKTTLLQLIWGFLRPDYGWISVFQMQPHLQQLSIRQHTGYLRASPILRNNMMVQHHLEFASQFHENWNKETCRLLLARFGVNPDLCIHQLSRTAKLQLALIAAMGHDPSLLLLDDPMAGLNLTEQAEVADFLNFLAAERGTTIILTSRDAAIASVLTDSLLQLQGGTIRALSSANEAFARRQSIPKFAHPLSPSGPRLNPS